MAFKTACGLSVAFTVVPSVQSHLTNTIDVNNPSTGKMPSLGKKNEWVCFLFLQGQGYSPNILACSPKSCPLEFQFTWAGIQKRCIWSNGCLLSYKIQVNYLSHLWLSLLLTPSTLAYEIHKLLQRMLSLPLSFAPFPNNLSHSQRVIHYSGDKRNSVGADEVLLQSCYVVFWFWKSCFSN